MRAVGLPEGLRVKVLDALWELARIPMPRQGKRDIQSMQRFARDTEDARAHTRDLLSKLAGYQAEGAQFRVHSRESLHVGASLGTWGHIGARCQLGSLSPSMKRARTCTAQAAQSWLRNGWEG